MRRVAILSVVLALALMTIGAAGVAAGSKFDEYGYNDTARLFNGPADGSDGNNDGTVWGDPTYAKDRLVMKWNAAWDACNDNGYNDPAFCLGAWTTNEWNGMVPGGSKSVWHYKIIWVGSLGEDSPYWRDGGYSIWNNYEVIMDHGVDMTAGPVHTWFAHAMPNGLGG